MQAASCCGILRSAGLNWGRCSSSRSLLKACFIATMPIPAAVSSQARQSLSGMSCMFTKLQLNGGGFNNKAMKGNMKTPSVRDIDMGSGGGSRSAADIMKVVRTRTPGLRHIYNKYLKKKPGLEGKVTLKFTIAPGGEVISIAVVSSTTGHGEFDGEIKNAVGRWTFSKVKSGNTTVTIPFTFTE